MNAVVSRFGLKAERPLRIGVDGLAGGLVLVFQSDLVAALLLHALRQAADRDLATYTEPAWGRHQNLDQAGQQSGYMKFINQIKYNVKMYAAQALSGRPCRTLL